MSKDIRSYFSLAGSGKKKETKDVETKLDKKTTKPQKKKRIAIISDSDDDDVPAPVKKQKPSNETCSKYFKEANKPVAEKPRVELKPVKAVDVFGCDTVKRSATKTPKEQVVEVPAHKNAKKKRVPVVTLDDDKDSDLDFEATLSQLDEIEAKANEEFLRESRGSREDPAGVGEGGKEPNGPANGLHEKQEKCEDGSAGEKRKHHTTKTKEPDSHETSKSRERDRKTRHGIEYISDSDEDADEASGRKTKKTKTEVEADQDKSSRGKTKKKEVEEDEDEDKPSRGKTKEDKSSRGKTKKTEVEEDQDKPSRGKTKEKEVGKDEDEPSRGKTKEDKSSRGKTKKKEVEEDEDKPSRGKTKEDKSSRGKTKKKEVEEDEDKPSRGKTKEDEPSRGKTKEDEPSRGKTMKKKEAEEDEDKPSRGKTKKKEADEDKPSRGKSKKKEADEEKPKKKKDDEDDTDDRPLWATDPAERRRVSAIGYQHYLQRGGPKHLGAKEIPTGTPHCLAGLTFVITGVLDSIERDDAVALVVACGGRVVTGVSRNTSYMVVGEDAGPAKVAKAEKLGTRTIGEDELFDLVRSRSGHKESQPQRAESDKSKRVSDPQRAESDKSKRVSDPQKADSDKSRQVSDPQKSDSEKSKYVSDIQKADSEKSERLTESASKSSSQRDPSRAEHTPPRPRVEPSVEPTGANQPFQSLPPSLLWVDKYRPTNIKNIIGQQGDKSNVKKLLNWLQYWHRNQFGGKKLVKPSPWARDDDGAFFKAALLSGPPGVGKTTSAHLVSKELGFDIVEFNASDTRSKRLLHEEVSELLSNKSLNDYFRGGNGKTTSKHVLLMDEVDGMAGNEDRGGMQELIQLIKNSKVPVLCMCNDVHHQKIRSLLGHCFDLRFQKPRVEQIRGAMQSVCFKEGVKIPPDLLTDMITGSNQDVRQVLHHLSLYSAKAAGATTVVSKHVRLGPWDVMRKVFSADEHRTMSVMDKSDLFFHDYNISPLFVQENYLSVLPDAARNDAFKRLDLIAQAADSICMGDTVERCIRSKNSWSLLPVQAMYASVIPGDLLEGHMTAQINFPSWLGKNSRRNKLDRLLQELHSHTRLAVSGNKQALNLDYLPRLREAIARPLIQRAGDGIPEAIEVLQTYHLLRSDIDSIVELSVWPGEQDPMSKVESKVKAALTRTYNKDLVLPYSTVMTVSKKKYVALTAEGDEDEEEEEEEEDEDDLSADAMIKAKKRPVAKKEPAAGPSAAKRGRGRGKK